MTRTLNIHFFRIQRFPADTTPPRYEIEIVDAKSKKRGQVKTSYADLELFESALRQILNFDDASISGLKARNDSQWPVSGKFVLDEDAAYSLGWIY